MQNKVIGFAGLLLLACGTKPTIDDFQVRVVWQQNPQEEVTIVWTEDSDFENSYIEFSADETMTGELIFPDQIPIRDQYRSNHIFETNNNPLARTAQFSELNPGTTYYFRIANSHHSSKTYSFVTAPEDGGFTLIIGGDSRSDQIQRRKLNRAIQQYWSSHPQVIAFVHGGDYVANGADWSQWSRWLNDADLININEQLLPIIPTRGNHEGDLELYQQVFGLAHGSYFATELPNLTLLTLDSEQSILGNQYTWLEQQLGDATTNNPNNWLIMNYHQPAYPAVKQPAATTKWVPLFEQYGVRLVFESDGHTFKRTAPIWQNQVDSERGIIYMGEGGLGVKQRTPHTDRWYFQGGGRALSRHHFMALTITNAQQLSVSAVDEHLESFDSLVLEQ